MDRDTVIYEVAAQIGTDPVWLDRLISFESDYNPQAVNRGDPQAKGLIQFRNAAAQDLGYKDSAEIVRKYPDFEGQMRGPVKAYFNMRVKQYGRLNDEYKLYMAVFHPAYIGKPANTLLPADARAANPKIKTPADYVALLNKKAGVTATAGASNTFLATAIAGYVAYLLTKYYKKR
jgi:hypothetical protein